MGDEMRCWICKRTIDEVIMDMLNKGFRLRSLALREEELELAGASSKEAMYFESVNCYGVEIEICSICADIICGIAEILEKAS